MQVVVACLLLLDLQDLHLRLLLQGKRDLRTTQTGLKRDLRATPPSILLLLLLLGGAVGASDPPVAPPPCYSKECAVTSPEANSTVLCFVFNIEIK